MHLQWKMELLLNCMNTRWLLQKGAAEAQQRQGGVVFLSSQQRARWQQTTQRNAGCQVARLLRVQGSSQQITFLTPDLVQCAPLASFAHAPSLRGCADPVCRSGGAELPPLNDPMTPRPEKANAHRVNDARNLQCYQILIQLRACVCAMCSGNARAAAAPKRRPEDNAAGG